MLMEFAILVDGIDGGEQMAIGKRACLGGLSLLSVVLCVLGPAGAQDTTDEEALLAHAMEPWTGDLDGMVERGFIRVLSTYNPLFFYYDGFTRRGLTYDAAQAFAEQLNKSLGKTAHRVHVVFIPVARDKLISGLADGKGDIAAANLTITPARQELAQFSDPFYSEVRELVVTGPAAPPIAALDDLVSTEIHLRPSSSYFEHLATLNQARKAEGAAELPVETVDERLEDYDLLDMVNAGLIPAIIVDSHIAALWAQVFENIKVHEDLAVQTGAQIAWAMRKDSPKLLAAVNGFVAQSRKGTLLGNIILKRYLGGIEWLDNALSDEGRKHYGETIAFIRKYSGQYNFDWLKIAAQGYQESKLDQDMKSAKGALGVMQVLPSTAADPNVNIPDIRHAENNIHAGVKYLRFLRDRYFSSPEIAPLDRVLFSFAAYNAGPGNLAKARKKATEMGLDPNQWFGHVEVAAARAISREPVIYVRNIYKYYVAYKLIEAERQEREAARQKKP
jgi:membrane-bound lytic murein transglycosylase MltF